MNLSARIAIPQHVIARKVGEDNVMLDLANGAYFGLDPVGAIIWQLLSEGLTLAQVCEAMVAEYEVAREEIERDVLALVEELAAHGLIQEA